MIQVLSFGKKQNVQCPNCKQFKVYNKRKLFVSSGLAFLVISLLLVFSIIFFIVGICLFLVGLGMIMIGLTTTDKDTLTCVGCNYEWKDN